MTVRIMNCYLIYIYPLVTLYTLVIIIYTCHTCVLLIALSLIFIYMILYFVKNAYHITIYMEHYKGQELRRVQGSSFYTPPKLTTSVSAVHEAQRLLKERFLSRFRSTLRLSTPLLLGVRLASLS